jgi:hypothetical protein
MLICIVDFYQRITSKRMRDYEIELNELRHTIQAEARAGLAEVTQTTSSTVAKLPSNLTELDTLLRKLATNSPTLREKLKTLSRHIQFTLLALRSYSVLRLAGLLDEVNHND